MNLHAIAAGAIDAVNPNVPVELQASTGYTTAADGTREPTYAAAVTVVAQVQAMTADELTQLDSLNLSGEKRGIYLYGQVFGVLRPQQVGGSLITMADGTIWLVVLVLEQWADWCKVAVTRQMA